MDKVKVLFIAGTGRCGSTLLNSILGQIDGAFAGGEIRYIWDRGLLDDSYCGCGERFSACSTWQTAVEHAYGPELPDPIEMMELRERVHTRHLFGTVFPFGRKRLETAIAPYLPSLGKLYDGIAASTGASVIIDTSKFPTHGFALSLLPNVELYVLHLVRDARAVAYSWQRRKQYGVDRNGNAIYMAQHHPIKSSYWWMTWNFLIENLWSHERYFRIRYEDFVAEPEGIVQQILEFVQLKVSADTVVKNKVVTLTPTHAVSGNPSRYEKGSITLRPDLEWRRNFRGVPFYATTLLLGYQLQRYKYSLLEKM